MAQNNNHNNKNNKVDFYSMVSQLTMVSTPYFTNNTFPISSMGGGGGGGGGGDKGTDGRKN